MISNCPKCGGRVSVSEHVDREAFCECPLCQARYAVTEVLDQTVPEIIILDKNDVEDASLSSPSDFSEPLAAALETGDQQASSALGDQLDANSRPHTTGALFDMDLPPEGDDELEPDNVESTHDAGEVEPLLGGAANLQSVNATLPIAEAMRNTEAEQEVIADDTEDSAAASTAGEVDGLEEMTGVADEELLTDFAKSDETADDLNLDFDDDDLSFELQENEFVEAPDTAPSQSGVGSVETEEERSVDARDAEANMADDAPDAAAPTGATPVEVVKPFDFKPSPSQVPASDFSPRVPRRQRNVASQVAKFGIAGVLVLLLCQAGLWWIGRLDPLGIASILPEAVSFLAPSALRKPSRDVAATGRTPGSPSNDEGLESPPDPMPTPESFFKVEESDSFNDARASAFPSEDIDGSGDNAVERPTGIEESSSPAQSGAVVAAEPPTLTTDPVDFERSIETDDATWKARDSESTLAEEAATMDESAASKRGLTAGPKYSPYDVGGSLETTRNAMDALLAAVAARADVNERKTLFARFYDSANDLAERAAYAGPGSELVFEEVHNFLNESSGIAVTIGKFAARTLPGSTRKGVFLAGTINDRVTNDSGYGRITLKLLGDSPQFFEVLTPDASSLAVGDKVFVLGVRVAQPSLEIVGYTSDVDQPLIWSEHIVPVKQ